MHTNSMKSEKITNVQVIKFNENLVDSMKYLSTELFNPKLWTTEFAEYANHTRVNSTFHDYIITFAVGTNVVGPIAFLKQIITLNFALKLYI